MRAIDGFFQPDPVPGPWAILVMMQASFLLPGTFPDDMAMLVIVAPLYVPLAASPGFDPVWRS